MYEKYKKDTQDNTKTVIASTASPFKFTRSVMTAIDKKYEDMEDFQLVDELSELAKIPVPQAIEEIRTAEIRHNTTAQVSQMAENRYGNSRRIYKRKGKMLQEIDSGICKKELSGIFECLYDAKDEKIKLKRVHTFCVVKAAEYITTREKISEEDRELALLIALLHDLGRI